MKNTLRTFLLILSVLITLLVGAFVVMLEMTVYPSDFFCGCSSGCTTYDVTTFSKLTSYLLLPLSWLSMLAALWKYRLPNRWLALPGLVVFGVALYGRSIAISFSGPCGTEWSKEGLFVHQELGIANAMYFLEGLPAEKLDSGLLDQEVSGFLVENNVLTLYRVNADPVRTNLGFFFWQIDTKKLLEDLPTYAGLSELRPGNPDANTHYFQLIGGRGTPMRAFEWKARELEQRVNGYVSAKELHEKPNGTAVLDLWISTNTAAQ